MKATQRKEVDMNEQNSEAYEAGRDAANRYAVSETREQAWQWAWRVYGVDAMGADWADAFRTELSL